MNRYLHPRRESLTRRVARILPQMDEGELFSVRRPFRHATVDLSCSCGSQNFKSLRSGSHRWECFCISGHFPGGVIITATQCPRSADSDVLPQRRYDMAAGTVKWFNAE